MSIKISELAPESAEWRRAQSALSMTYAGSVKIQHIDDEAGGFFAVFSKDYELEAIVPDTDGTALWAAITRAAQAQERRQEPQTYTPRRRAAAQSAGKVTIDLRDLFDLAAKGEPDA